ncbi:MAG TPA: CIA30 family protein, partial [Edaphobacter sp.]|nr:CIA30 family protein [Edaphobacter sp.]
GAVELADISAFKGIRFKVRGEGSYRLLMDSYGARRSGWYAASFPGTAQWKTIRIPFTAFQSKSSTSSLPLRNLRALRFELARPAGTDAWLEIDDVKLY